MLCNKYCKKLSSKISLHSDNSELVTAEYTYMVLYIYVPKFKLVNYLKDKKRIIKNVYNAYQKYFKCRIFSSVTFYSSLLVIYISFINNFRNFLCNF